MPSLENLLAYEKRWAASYTLDGDVFTPENDLPSRSISLTQIRSTCQFDIKEYPDMEAGSDAEVTIELNGESERFFTGFVAERPVKTDYHFTVTLNDILGRLDADTQSEITWSDTDWVDAARQILNEVGIEDGNIGTLFDPGDDFKLGPDYAIIIPAGTSAQSVMSELLSFAGCAILADYDGNVEIVDYPGWGAPLEESIVYARGANREASELGFTDGGRTLGGSEGHVKSFTAKGPKKPNLHIPDATFTISGATGKDVVKNYQYLQTDEAASAIAEREVVRENYRETIVEIQAPLNTSLRPGHSLWFRDEVIGFIENTAALVLSIRTRSVEMTLTLSVGAEPASGELTLIPPPDADFTFQCEVQPITLAGVLQSSVVVQCTDTSSDPSSFTITSRAWTATCSGTVDPSSSSELDPIFTFSTLTGATITLVIEASSGEGDIETKSISPDPSETFTRQLSVAAGPNGWKILVDESGWRSYGSDCTAVPNINPTTLLLAGFENGELYSTEDALLSAPTLLNTFADAVTCIFVNELDPSHVVLGSGNTLFISTSNGLFWSTLHTFDDPVNYAETSPEVAIKYRVCSGKFLWYSEDGSSWSTLVEGPDDSTCMKVASAPWGHLAVFTNTPGNVEAVEDQRPWLFEEGWEINWDLVPDDQIPATLDSVTPWEYAEGYIVSCGQGHTDLIRDGLFGQLTYVASPQADVQLYKLTQTSPGNFSAEYITTATESGPLKLVNHAAAYKIDAVDQVYRIGYGQAMNPLLPPRLILLPQTADPTYDYIHMYDPAEGWTYIDPPAAARVWRGIVINPRNQAEWIIFWTATLNYDDDGAGAFYTANSGVTWVEITELGPTTLLGQRIGGVAWTGVGSGWFMTGTRHNGFNLNQYVYDQRGDGASLVDYRYVLAGVGTAMHRSVMPGIGGFMVSYKRDTSFDWIYFPDGEATFEDIFTSPAPPGDLLTGVDSQMIGVQGTNIYYTPDYATTVPTIVTSAGTSAVAMADGRILVGGRTSIAEITGFPGSPAVNPIAAFGLTVSTINRGPTRRYAAAFTSDGKIYGWNGIQWGSIDSPSPITFCQVIGILEI